MITEFINCRTVLPDGIKDVPVFVENGRIRSAGGDIQADETVDCGGLYLAPGFVDIHTHGGGGADFLDGTAEAYITASRMHASHGTTTIVPTATSVDVDTIVTAVGAFNEAKKAENMPDMPGIHLEGPFLASSHKGAQEERFIHPFDMLEADEIMDAAKKANVRILRWTAAPELYGVEEFSAAMFMNGILPCIGHSDADFSETVYAFRQGFTHVTHLYSCMSTIKRVHAFRVGGIIEAAYFIDDMTVEIIADGCHIPFDLIRYCYKFKGREKTALVTDSMRAAGMPDGPSVLGKLDNGLPVISAHGVAWLEDRSAFAGSTATADRLVRTVCEAGIPLADACYMMSTTPCEILGLRDRGKIEAGLRADLVTFDKKINVRDVYVNGSKIQKI